MAGDGHSQPGGRPGEGPSSGPADGRIDLTVIVPLYDEGPTLRASLDRLSAWLAGCGRRWEAILVDDGSRDDSRAVADAFVEAHPELPLRCAHHAHNTGRGGAVLDGLALARGTYAGFLDIDLEVAETCIGPCLAALDAGADVAVGLRGYELASHSLLRHVLSRGYSRLARAILGTRLRDTESGFKWFRRAAIAPILPELRHRGWFFDTEIMLRAERAGLAIAEVPVRFQRRFDKRSTVRPLRDSLAYLAALLRFRLSLRREGRPRPPR